MTRPLYHLSRQRFLRFVAGVALPPIWSRQGFSIIDGNVPKYMRPSLDTNIPGNASTAVPSLFDNPTANRRDNFLASTSIGNLYVPAKRMIRLQSNGLVAITSVENFSPDTHNAVAYETGREFGASVFYAVIPQVGNFPATAADEVFDEGVFVRKLENATKSAFFIEKTQGGYGGEFVVVTVRSIFDQGFQTATPIGLALAESYIADAGGLTLASRKIIFNESFRNIPIQVSLKKSGDSSRCVVSFVCNLDASSPTNRLQVSGYTMHHSLEFDYTPNSDDSRMQGFQGSAAFLYQSFAGPTNPESHTDDMYLEGEDVDHDQMTDVMFMGGLLGFPQTQNLLIWRDQWENSRHVTRTACPSIRGIMGSPVAGSDLADDELTTSSPLYQYESVPFSTAPEERPIEMSPVRCVCFASNKMHFSTFTGDTRATKTPDVLRVRGKDINGVRLSFSPVGSEATYFINPEAVSYFNGQSQLQMPEGVLSAEQVARVTASRAVRSPITAIANYSDFGVASTRQPAAGDHDCVAFSIGGAESGAGVFRGYKEETFTFQYISQDFQRTSNLTMEMAVRWESWCFLGLSIQEEGEYQYEQNEVVKQVMYRSPDSPRGRVLPYVFLAGGMTAEPSISMRMFFKYRVALRTSRVNTATSSGAVTSEGPVENIQQETAFYEQFFLTRSETASFCAGEPVTPTRWQGTPSGFLPAVYAPTSSLFNNQLSVSLI